MAQGRDTISQRIAIEGAVDVIRALKDMGAAGEKAIAQIQGAISASTGTTSKIGSVTDTIRGHFAAIHQQLGQVKEKFGELHEAAHKFGESINNTAEKIVPHFREVAALAFAGSVAGVVALVKETANFAQEIKKTSDELGVSTQEYQKLQFITRSTGLDQERFVSTFTRLARSVGEAAVQAQKHLEDMVEAVAGKKPVNDVVAFDTEERIKERAKRLTATIDKQIPGLQAAVQRMYDAMVGKFLKAGGNLRELQPFNSFLLDAIKLANEASDAGAKFRTELFRFEGVVTPMKHVSEALERTKINVSEIDVLFRQLGVSIKDAVTGKERPLGEIFSDLAINLHKVGDAGQQAYYAQLFLNRGFKEVLPLYAHNGEAIKKLTEEYEKLQKAFELDPVKEVETVSSLYAAFAKLGLFLETVRVKFLAIFAPDITRFLDEMVTLIADNTDGIKRWASAIQADLAPGLEELSLLLRNQILAEDVQTGWLKTLIVIYQTVKAVVIDVGIAFGILVKAMEGVARLINSVFPTNFTGKELAVLLILAQITGAVSILITGLELARVAWGLFWGAAGGWPVQIIKIIAVVTALIIAFWPDIQAAAEKAWNNIYKGFADLFNAESWKKAFAGLLDFLVSIGTFIDGLLTKAASLLGLSGESKGAESPPLASSGGGGVPGSGRGDHVRALLEPGEFVVKRPTVAALGLGFMNALNQGLVSRFSLGGIVGALRQTSPEPYRMAAGGLVPAMAGGSRGTLHLTIEGRTYKGLTAPADVMDSLTQHAVTSSIISTGKKPKWHGSG